MNRLRAALGRLHERLFQQDLRGKITAALLSVTLLTGAVVTLSAYLAARYQITNQTHALLEARAQLEQREMELRLTGVLSLAESLASNTVTANALADSRGRDIYLTPLLRNQKLAIAGATLTVADYRGRPVAASVESAPDYTTDPGFAAMMQTGHAHARVVQSDGQPAAVVVALPIRYRLTNNVEGGVLLHIPLAPLLGSTTPADSRWITNAAGTRLAEQPPHGDVFKVETPLVLPAPLDTMKLALVLARDKTAALRTLDLLLAVFLLIGIFIVAGVVIFARAGARLIATPLAAIAAAAEEIAASGRPVARLPENRTDEIGRLSAAFNTMVDRLAESYADLEQRVVERTREYEESQQEARKAGNLLREAVSSIAQGFTIYDENDRLVLCNEAYRGFYGLSSDLIVPGNTFEQIIRGGAERGQFLNAEGHIDEWVAQRVEQHQAASGQVIEQQLADGRWLLIVEHLTPSGYIVGNRIDITELKTTTEALRQRELYLRATLDNLPFLFWLKDSDGRFLSVNKRFADACGRSSPEELEGLTDSDVWPADLARSYRADDLEVMTSRMEKTVEEPMSGDSGNTWIETYKKPVISPDGTLLGTVGFARDISERKQMLQALAASEQRWQLAVSGANDGIWDWDPKTNIVYFSERWKTMLGYSADEVGSSLDDWTSRVHPDDLAATMDQVQRHLRGETEFYESEHRLRCKNGDYKWILDRGRALLDENGNPLRMSGSHTDISARRAADAAVQDRTEQLNAIFALSPDGFVSFDGERRIKYVSPAFMRMTGLLETEVVGLDETRFSALLAAACIPQARFAGIASLRALKKVPQDAERNAGDTASEVLQQIELATAGKRVLEVGLREAHGESVSQILYLRDITHETEVDRLKSEFLSTAAHELRTPMASIYGFSELLLSQDFDADDQRDFLSTIFRQSELMVSIINELLDLARIEARRGKDFVIARFDLRALIDEIVAGFKPPGDRASPEKPAADGPLWVSADQSKMIQAISNVLSNAYKYSPEGGPVKIEFITPEQSVTALAGGPAPTIGIRIIDSGIGMSQEQLSRVFERFYRADTSGKIPGTGLGMSIVKEIVELHGGRIDIQSETGSGTSVSLLLPSASSADRE